MRSLQKTIRKPSKAVQLGLGQYGDVILTESSSISKDEVTGAYIDDFRD